MIASLADTDGMPVKRPELTSTSSSVCATNGLPSSSSAGPSAGSTTRRMGSSNAVAKSKSRWSWAGTAMIAPVPYSIST